MQQIRNRRRAPIIAVGCLLTLSAGAVALAQLLPPSIVFPPFEFEQISELLDPGALFRVSYENFPNTGFTIRGLDDSVLTLDGRSKYDPEAGLQPGEKVQEGFVLLDGTLSLDITAVKEGGIRARARTTYRFDVRRRALERDSIVRALRRQGVVRDLARARARARAMRLDDARVMRLVEGREGAVRWIRAVRALRSPGIRAFFSRKAPDGVLGHFGTAISEGGDPYVWAVLDRSSRYGIGLTVDRDNDGVPNASDNCIGSINPNQSDTDGDGAGDECDFDDDDDGVLDGDDNCPLSVNPDQADFDRDGLGNACDFDDDNDEVADGIDQCLATAAGELVDAAGCSIADRCPCGSEWRNHGAYVRCVAHTSGDFVKAGLITEAEKDAIVSAAAQSVCGR